MTSVLTRGRRAGFGASARPPISLLAAAALAAAAAALPLGYLLVRVSEIGLDPALSALQRPGTVDLIARSLLLLVAVSGTCLVLGVASATALVRWRWPGGRLWIVVAALPLAVPSYVAAFGWVATIPGWGGLVPSWLVLSAVSMPYVTLPVIAALRGVDADLVEVARSLGASPAGAWWSAVVPQIAPAAAAGTLLVGLYVLSDFGAVSIFRYPVFTVAISRDFQSFVGRDSALVLALVLVVLAVLLVLAERGLRGRADRWRVGSGARRPLTPRAPGRWAVPAAAVVLAAPVVAVVVPVATLLDRLRQGTGRTFDAAELWAAIVATAGVGAAAALVALVLAVPIGLLAARYRGVGVGAIETAGYSGHALPGLVVALSLVYFSLRVVPSLYQGIAVLIFAYVVLFLPKAIGATRTSIAQVPPVLGEVARSLGRGRLGAARATTWRLASPGLAAGTVLVMLTAMKELPATLILRPSGLDTLATEIWTRTSTAAFGAAAPYALALLAVAALPAFALARVDGLGSGRG